MSLFRSHPFLSVTAVALATNAIQLLIPLLEDLNIEGAEEKVTVRLVRFLNLFYA